MISRILYKIIISQISPKMHIKWLLHILYNIITKITYNNAKKNRNYFIVAKKILKIFFRSYILATIDFVLDYYFNT